MSNSFQTGSPGDFGFQAGNEVNARKTNPRLPRANLIGSSPQLAKSTTLSGFSAGSAFGFFMNNDKTLPVRGHGKNLNASVANVRSLLAFRFRGITNFLGSLSTIALKESN